MKAVIAGPPGQPPRFADVATPVAGADEELVDVRAASISHVTRSRASGVHYSAQGGAGGGVGVDGVGPARGIGHAEEIGRLSGSVDGSHAD